MSPRRAFFKRPIFLISLSLVLIIVSGIWLSISRMQARALEHAQTGKSAINLLSEIAASVREKDIDRLLENYSKDFHNSERGQWVARPENRDDGITVSNWHAEGGASDFETVARWWRDYLIDLQAVALCKFKLTALTEIGPPHRIRATLWVRGEQNDGRKFESQIRFRIALADEEGFFRISAQELVDGETVIGPGRGFTDIAELAGLDFRATQNRHFEEVPRWRDSPFGIAKYSSAGVTAVDYDNDGWYDIFLANGGRARLYRNLGGARFEDVTDRVGLPEDLVGVNAGIFADLDNDGHKDLFTPRFTEDNRLFRNRGDGTFEEKTLEGEAARGIVAVASAADYDNDGDLDLYLGRYLDPSKNIPTTIFYTRNSEGNTLLRNDGNFVFTDVTENAGVREGGLTLGTAWADYDRDGDQDLYVANDFGRNAMLRNEGDGRFRDVSEETGAFDLGYGMSATFADANNDGWLDLYIANVHSSTRWFGQAPILYNYILTSVRQGTIVQDLPAYRDIYQILGLEWTAAGDHLIKGNTLLINDGTGGFADIGERSRANPFGWYWGSTLFDYDNDGLQDIYTVNGFVTGKVTDDL